jgi:hypothetical protein
MRLGRNASAEIAPFDSETPLNLSGSRRILGRSVSFRFGKARRLHSHRALERI